MKELIILERKNGWYGGYEKTKNGYDQVFNTNDKCLFIDMKLYTDKGYKIKCLDKTQEDEFMQGRTTFEEYMKIDNDEQEMLVLEQQGGII